ncbi:multidrug efflux SMR transporter [Halalkalibacterium halodurans]|uniref:Multidrug resistance protein n=1 Tax=Halalkalibacterium halodurans (strain ATCC BAA-125 / DSM 18197 / FERM 7344 / JCM 9153 / C-125) TaxID=272558 RepID=Q9KEL2_HALH5|nr:multidrug efflux SMR transporter [Halalkalibacterium halodurans]MDY7221338.1 multidrug efflux SMR transporter [Halalkalibacterium halodurans]MDY7240577.1 multidrug efflux SMR transporter [Halalkalibacterium halodurans]MED4081389.1 multidrug efflux SMR transporter [Halalkalibacterium halodurans]MED4083329.1 multidrug efflux SMR transporter [Halalkalibacterium halodurans]MED4106480.1 multidrug efflux SMR transporter [Halalkalibacterium halodurans]
MAYLFLSFTILTEVIGAISSRYSEGFKKFIPSVITFIVIIASYYFFAVSLQYGLNIGIGYAIWSGVGVSVITCFGFVFLKESVTKVQLLGIVLIVVGIVTLEFGGL